MMRVIAGLLFVLGLVVAGSTSAYADPPLGEPWQLVFDEEFNGNQIDPSIWSLESGPENILVYASSAHFASRHEERGGTPWTNGRMTTRTYHQSFGYVEARIKMIDARGAHERFSLISEDPSRRFEIAIADFASPDRLAIGVYDVRLRAANAGTTRNVRSSETATSEYHVYGIEWSNASVRWFLDGRPVETIACAFCIGPANIRLSMAVARADRPTLDLEGRHMDVDWIRAYTRDR